MISSTRFSGGSRHDFAREKNKGALCHELERIDQRILALERRRNFRVVTERKRTALKKSYLGALVVTAGLSGADRAFLLGAFIELSRIVPGTHEHQRLRAIGEAVFRNRRRKLDDRPTKESEGWP